MTVWTEEWMFLGGKNLESLNRYYKFWSKSSVYIVAIYGWNIFVETYGWDLVASMDILIKNYNYLTFYRDVS